MYQVSSSWNLKSYLLFCPSVSFAHYNFSTCDCQSITSYISYHRYVNEEQRLDSSTSPNIKLLVIQSKLTKGLYCWSYDNYWKVGGSVNNPPSRIPALWNIGILLHKQATHPKHIGLKCTNDFQILSRYLCCNYRSQWWVEFKLTWFRGFYLICRN